jgi:hypothetical protein
MIGRIDLRAVIIAFAIELGLDSIISSILLLVMGAGVFGADMSDADFRKAAAPIIASFDFLLAGAVFGTATTIAGGYLAARLANAFPLYNGLAMGVVGLVFNAFQIAGFPAWYITLALLSPIPCSIYGAYLARKHKATVQ